MSNSRLRTIFVFLVTATICGCGCNGDDPPKPPVPTGVTAINGLFYRGNMGSGDMDQPLVFAVADNKGVYVPDQWIHFSLPVGDGVISADSLKTGSDGKVTLAYTFSGNLGHAEIRAIARNLDTTYVYLRANTLIPGDHGQGQYVLLDDTYGDVVDFNGPPVALDTFPAVGIAVANYEATLGVVVVIYDTDENGVIEDTSPVWAVIVVDSVYPQPRDSTTMSARYEGTTAEGIGIGSHWMDDVVPVFAFPDTVIEDNDDPQLLAYKIVFELLHLTFWCRQSDSTAFQIDIAEEFDVSLYESPPVREAIDSVMRIVGQHLRGPDALSRQ